MVRTICGMMVGMALVAGCHDNTPPPPNVPVPTTENRDAIRTSDPVKPLPPQPRQVEQAE